MYQVSRKVMFRKQFLGGISARFRAFPKYHMKILVGDFNAKLEREGNGVRAVKFVTQKIWFLRA
jgi:hypothetical protein